MPPPLYQKRPFLGPGRLDRQVIIKSASTGGSYGGSDPDWTNPSTVATAWGRKVVRRGTEVVDGRQIQATANVVWEVLYRTGITTSMRLYDGSTVYDIVFVDDQRKLERFMELICVQRQA